MHYLDGDAFAAVFTLHHVLDDRITALVEHLVHDRYAVERESYAKEIHDLVQKYSCFFLLT